MKLMAFLLLFLTATLSFNAAIADNSKHSNCLSEGYICFSNDDFVDSAAVLKDWGLTVYFLKEKMTRQQKMRYAQKGKAISVSKVSGRFEVYFKQRNPADISKYKLGVNVNREWKRENGVTGIYVDVNSSDFETNPGFKVDGIIASGATVEVSGAGNGKSEDLPIDIKWKFDTNVEILN